jgi:hypothetical protein
MLKKTFEIFDGKTVLQLSAFSRSMDCNSAPCPRNAISSQRNNWSRQEQTFNSELTKLIQTFESKGASVAAVYDLSNGAASSSSALPASIDSLRCYYQSGVFKECPPDKFKSTFAQKIALYSSLGSQDYALSFLGSTLMDNVSEGQCLVALGSIG